MSYSLNLACQASRLGLTHCKPKIQPRPEPEPSHVPVLAASIIDYILNWLVSFFVTIVVSIIAPVKSICSNSIGHIFVQSSIDENDENEK